MHRNSDRLLRLVKMHPPLSVVLLAHTQSALLEEVLRSVHWCDEIIVVLSNRNSDLENYLSKVKAKVFFRELDGFGPQKQFAISQATHDWILSIDSDEVVSPLLKSSIEKRFQETNSALPAAFSISRKLFFCGRPLRFSGTATRPLRLFNRHLAQMSSDKVHESIKTKGPCEHLSGELLHFSYESFSDYLTKFNRYTSLAAEELFQKKAQTNSLLAWLRFPLLFTRRYLLQLGFLDGGAGFAWCFFSALYSSVKYLKLRELHKKSMAS